MLVNKLFLTLIRGLSTVPNVIIVRAPLRISFVGGGTDLPAFYTQEKGGVISATIDKYVYVLINKIVSTQTILKYSQIEVANDVSELKHTRIKAALEDLGYTEGGLEIGSFADVPASSGLGSSSSFSVALLKGLHALKNNILSKETAAQAACRLELELLGEPIGKQDQYAASYGGFNTITFSKNEDVHVEPLHLHFQTEHDLSRHMILFGSGITHSAGTILAAQQSEIDSKRPLYRKTLEYLTPFKNALMRSDFKTMGIMLHELWELKKQFSSAIAHSHLDKLYDAGCTAGAWGGKVLGAGGGGCLLLLAPPESHEAILGHLYATAEKLGLGSARHIQVSFTHTGTDILLNDQNNTWNGSYEHFWEKHRTSSATFRPLKLPEQSHSFKLPMSVMDASISAATEGHSHSPHTG